jgi:hypothetical protein
MRHTPSIENIIYSLPLWDKDAKDLETVAKELGIKHEPEIIQEDLACKILNLIATAPELLEACKKAVLYVNASHSIKQQLESVIAKAEGR